MYVCIYVRTYVRMYVCMYVYMYVRTYVCAYVYMYACFCYCRNVFEFVTSNAYLCALLGISYKTVLLKECGQQSSVRSEIQIEKLL